MPLLTTVAARARADRIFTWPRFGGNGVPLAVARQVAAIPGVKAVTALNFLPGYVQDPKNQVFVLMIDKDIDKVFHDYGITTEQWNMVWNDRTGVVMSTSQAARWHKKVGDTFTMISKQIKRADGKTSWDFKVLAIVDEPPQTRAASSSAITIISTRPSRWPTRAR